MTDAAEPDKPRRQKMSRGKAVREKRKWEAVDLYCQGKRQVEIAETLGISQPTVARYLKAAFDEWRAKGIGKLDEHKQRELAKIDMLEREAWAAFERSKERQRRESSTNEKGQSEKTVVQEFEGNPQFLDRVAWCIAERCRIMGLYAPKVRRVVGGEAAARLASLLGLAGAEELPE